MYYKECRFMTLFFEPAPGCCRAAVPVVFLPALANRGAELVWNDIAASITQWDIAWLEAGNEVISPWQTGKGVHK